MAKKNKRIIYFAIGTGLILLIPLVLTLINPNATINGGQEGMAIALYITAFAQMLVPAVAFFIWPPSVISWSLGKVGSHDSF